MGSHKYSAIKPFVNISTTPSDSLTPFEEMNFVKTRSSIYSPFHKTTRTVNFDIGYSNKAKWFETLNDKWSEYSNFYIAGFLEEIYSTNSTSSDTSTETAYAQINAKIIDYDPRFRHSKTPTSTTSTITSPKSTNVFAKRRLTASSTTTKSETTPIISTTPTSITTKSQITPIVSTTPQNENENQLNDNDSIHSIQSTDPQSPNSTPTHVITPISQTRHTRKRRQLSNLCDTDEDPIDNNDPINDNDPISPPPKPKRVYKKKVITK